MTGQLMSFGQSRFYERIAEEIRMEHACMGEAPCVEVDKISEDRPSANFIYAISEFLDTDPDDLLLELGYYDRNLVETS
jgi:hypothetical protein